MRVAYKRILETQDHLEVVGMAGDGEEAVSLAAQLKPDVVVLDVRMPRMNGIEASQRITADQPGTGIVIISLYDDTEYILEFLKDGAEGKPESTEGRPWGQPLKKPAGAPLNLG